jgi:hypothetical protein
MVRTYFAELPERAALGQLAVSSFPLKYRRLPLPYRIVGTAIPDAESPGERHATVRLTEPMDKHAHQIAGSLIDKITEQDQPSK